jgi:hypothetical protein
MFVLGSKKKPLGIVIKNSLVGGRRITPPIWGMFQPATLDLPDSNQPFAWPKTLQLFIQREKKSDTIHPTMA